jgi:hypothetical protein
MLYDRLFDKCCKLIKISLMLTVGKRVVIMVRFYTSMTDGGKINLLIL